MQAPNPDRRLLRGCASLLASLLLLVAAACQPAPAHRDGTPSASTGTDTSGVDVTGDGPVEVRIGRARYRAGDDVELTFVNHAEATYTFNPCLRTVERDEGGAWVPVEEPDRRCTMEAWLLDPGAIRTATTDLPPSLAPGRYRLVVALTQEGTTPAERTQAVSAPISVVS